MNPQFHPSLPYQIEAAVVDLFGGPPQANGNLSVVEALSLYGPFAGKQRNRNSTMVGVKI